MPTVETAGRISGAMILKKMPQTPQPSMQAASSSSRGISFIKPVQIRIPIASAKAA